MNSRIKKMANALLIVGFDVHKFYKNVKNAKKFLSDRKTWKNSGGKIDSYFPILTDYGAQAGSAQGHYFHQDLIVAKEIFRQSPRRHIDVGSRVDGFVAHVASFREIEIIDIRPIEIGHGIKFTETDLTKPHRDKADSVSCLHALEHFGLGRYKDDIDPSGHFSGFRNLVELVEDGGMLYLSFPVSSNPRVEFNAHRVLSTTEIFEWEGAQFLDLEKYWLIDDSGQPKQGAEPSDSFPLRFGCAIYAFRKKNLQFER